MFTRLIAANALRGYDEFFVIGAYAVRGLAWWPLAVVPVSILFPVYFRHPEAPPLPGDTILKKAGVARALNPPPPATNTGQLAASASKSSSGTTSGNKKATPSKRTR